MDIVQEFSDAVAIVRATSFEKLSLWRTWHEQRGCKWEDTLHGQLVTVGYISGNKNRPVCISLFSFVFEGRRVLAVEDTSRWVDHTMIDEWLRKNFPNISSHDDTDAGNFHNIYHKIQRMNRGEQ